MWAQYARFRSACIRLISSSCRFFTITHSLRSCQIKARTNAAIPTYSHAPSAAYTPSGSNEMPHPLGECQGANQIRKRQVPSITVCMWMMLTILIILITASRVCVGNATLPPAGLTAIYVHTLFVISILFSIMRTSLVIHPLRCPG
jgi:hypothetical protein